MLNPSRRSSLDKREKERKEQITNKYKLTPPTKTTTTTTITTSSGKTYERLNTPRKDDYYDLIDIVPSIKSDYEKRLKEKHGLQPTPVGPYMSGDFRKKLYNIQPLKPLTPNIIDPENVKILNRQKRLPSISRKPSIAVSRKSSITPISRKPSIALTDRKPSLSHYLKPHFDKEQIKNLVKENPALDQYFKDVSLHGYK